VAGKKGLKPGLPYRLLSLQESTLVVWAAISTTPPLPPLPAVHSSAPATSAPPGQGLAFPMARKVSEAGPQQFCSSSHSSSGCSRKAGPEFQSSTQPSALQSYSLVLGKVLSIYGPFFETPSCQRLSLRGKLGRWYYDVYLTCGGI
jgi:hypothetical protein